MEKIDKELLEQIADMHSIPEGSLNIRKNGEVLKRVSNSDIEILPKKDKNGIDIKIKSGITNKSVHIPVIVSKGGFNDVVYNDFYVGDNAQVLIIAGCGIHNDTNLKSEHDGIHSFHIGKNCQVKYIERHLGLGSGKGGKVLNPVTKIFLGENSSLEMQTIQLGGVTYSNRKTNATLKDNAKLLIEEKILTTGGQLAKTNFKVCLKGKNSSVDVISRSVAKDKSHQEFNSKLIGQNSCFGHVECDGIVLNKATISSSPAVYAESTEATLIHEAAIGKIAGEQLIKLQSLGLTEEEAQNEIIKGFLK